MSNNPTIPPILSPTEPRGKVQVPAMSVRDAQVLGRPHAVRGLLLQRALSGESVRGVMHSPLALALIFRETQTSRNLALFFGESL